MYVRAGATGAGDGTSWADAFPELRQALQAALPPAEVWVAAGDYMPTGGADRTAAFRLVSGIALYGGFGGFESQRDERNWQANETVLSGEINDPTEVDDNACHVVVGSGVDSTAVLDGFTVRGGYARSCVASRGGGLYSVGGSPLVQNVRFTSNLAVGGGAVYNLNGANGTFRDCLFDANESVSGGGGMANEASHPRVERVRFVGNDGDSGGALLNWRGANPVCIDCDFANNSSHFPGGAVYNTQSSPLFIRSTFVGNTSPNGGGALYNDEEVGDMVCIDCVFRNNSTSIGTGGAAMVRLLARPVFINTLFEGNSADDGYGGAIISDTGSELLFVNVVFVGNRAETGGAATFHTGSRRLVNVTFAGNRSQQGGGALEIGFGETDVLNSVLWDNGRFDGPGEILHTGGALTIRHSLVSGGCAPPFVCEAVIDADPLFVRPPAWSGTTLTDAGDLRLRVGSPAIDAGLAAYLPADLWDLDGDGDTTEVLPIDILGQPRVQDAEVDLGAYEGGVVVAGEPAPAPADLSLRVSPNPAPGAATLTLELPAAGRVEVAVYDLLGRRVGGLHAGPLPAGRHVFTWGAGVPAGVYHVWVSATNRAAGATLTIGR